MFYFGKLNVLNITDFLNKRKLLHTEGLYSDKIVTHDHERVLLRCILNHLFSFNEDMVKVSHKQI